MQRGQAWLLGLGARQQLLEPLRFACVLAVPNDQGAVVLKKHWLFQLSDQFRPSNERVLAQAHHGQFGDGRLGQGRQHGGRHTGCRTLGIGALCFMHVDPVALTRQAVGQ